MTYRSKCIGDGEVRFKTKFDRFNCGLNLDVGVSFGFNAEITLKYDLKGSFELKLRATFH